MCVRVEWKKSSKKKTWKCEILLQKAKLDGMWLPCHINRFSNCWIDFSIMWRQYLYGFYGCRFLFSHFILCVCVCVCVWFNIFLREFAINSHTNTDFQKKETRVFRSIGVALKINRLIDIIIVSNIFSFIVIFLEICVNWTLGISLSCFSVVDFPHCAMKSLWMSAFCHSFLFCRLTCTKYQCCTKSGSFIIFEHLISHQIKADNYSSVYHTVVFLWNNARLKLIHSWIELSWWCG